MQTKVEKKIVGYVDLELLKPKPPVVQIAEWYLFRVWAMSEEKIADKIGPAAYFPRRKYFTKRRGRLQVGYTRREGKFAPVIPGYIFFNGEPNDASVNWIYADRRFIGLLSKNGEPSRVPNADIHRMRMAELADSAEVIEVFSVIVGEILEIHNGPYAGKIGVVRDLEFGKARLEFPLDRQFAKFSVSELGKISFKP